ncbi:hypothetical protein [Streptomyces sp. NPDC058297]|uniref:hypothetical protein n=1 Tax=Streptomyces sp. NPDC058297 TaxID=3346433 RepID=UPI0036E2007E
MWLRQVTGERRLRAAATRTAGALVATATALTALGAAAPASADVSPPFAKRYEASLYGDFVTIGNTVTDCPKAARRGGDDPCTSVVTPRREQARPVPPQESHGPELARTGGSHTLLHGGLAASLCGLGVLAVAAARSRRD